MTLLSSDHEHLIVATERFPNVGLCAASETCTAIRIRDGREWREPNAREAAAIVASMLDAINELGKLDGFLDVLEHTLEQRSVEP